MAEQVYRQGNYLIIQDSVSSDVLYSKYATNVLIEPDGEDPDLFRFYYTINYQESTERREFHHADIADLVDLDVVAYTNTSFIEFYTQNTGPVYAASSGFVETVTGTPVDNTDPFNPIIIGVGDMLASVYDPTGLAVDVYDKANEIGITQSTGSIITPPTLTVTTDDYSPTGFSTANIIRQDINANRRQIRGFVAPPAGVNRIIRVFNINTSGWDISYMHNNAGSAVGNRLLMRDSGNKDSKPNEVASFWYDHISSAWRPYNRIG